MEKSGGSVSTGPKLIGRMELGINRNIQTEYINMLVFNLGRFSFYTVHLKMYLRVRTVY